MSKEIIAKLSLGHVKSFTQIHSENVTIELNRLLRILYSQHGLSKSVFVGNWRVLSSGNNLNPVIIWVETEGKGLHHTLVRAFTELYPVLF